MDLIFVITGSSLFKQLIAKDMLEVVATPTDGNCMFHAIASQLMENESTAA